MNMHGTHLKVTRGKSDNNKTKVEGVMKMLGCT
jgi:hypothetical protein